MSNNNTLAAATVALLVAITASVLAACSHDAYETGDGSYSYLRTELVMAKTGEAQRLVSAVTDDNSELSFIQPLNCSWATKNDSSYRALLYYNKVGTQASPISAQQVLWLTPKKLKDDEELMTDALGLQSAWLSAQGKYLNLCLLVKTGVAEGLDAKQIVGCVAEKTEEELTDGESVSLTLYHNQNSVPEYYTSRVYATVPLSSYSESREVVLKINTYDGIKTVYRSKE